MVLKIRYKLRTMPNTQKMALNVFKVSDFCQFMTACDKSCDLPGWTGPLHNSVSCISLRPDPHSLHGCMLQ